jgi:hypothetical protein
MISLPVTVLARLGNDHIDDMFRFIDFVEKTVITDPVSPGLRLIILQLFDMFTKMRGVSQLRIDIF